MSRIIWDLKFLVITVVVIIIIIINVIIIIYKIFTIRALELQNLIREYRARAARNRKFFSNIPTSHNKFIFFGSKPFQNCKKKFKKLMFRYCYLAPKFYYISHLWKIGLQTKFKFFQVFENKNCFSFLYLNSTWKMCSFEVHYVDVAQKLRKLEGGL